MTVCDSFEGVTTVPGWNYDGALGGGPGGGGPISSDACSNGYATLGYIPDYLAGMCVDSGFQAPNLSGADGWFGFTLDTKYSQAGIDNASRARNALGNLNLSGCGDVLNKALAGTGYTAGDIGSFAMNVKIQDGSSAGGEIGNYFTSNTYAGVMAATISNVPKTVFVRSDIWGDTNGTWGGLFEATLVMPAFQGKKQGHLRATPFSPCSTKYCTPWDQATALWLQPWGFRTIPAIQRLLRGRCRKIAHNDKVFHEDYPAPHWDSDGHFSCRIAVKTIGHNSIPHRGSKGESPRL